MQMTKETMHESIARALHQVRTSGKSAEATLSEDDENELNNELVLLTKNGDVIEMHAGWNEHEMESVYSAEATSFDVDAAIAAAWPGL